MDCLCCVSFIGKESCHESEDTKVLIIKLAGIDQMSNTTRIYHRSNELHRGNERSTAVAVNN